MKQLFDEVYEDCITKYDRKIPLYGTSWKELSLNELREKLHEEFQEWTNTSTYSDFTHEYQELLDIINVASMIAKRIKKGQGDE